MRNGQVNVATDLVVICRDGRRKHLSEIKTDYLLLYFNNPDCADCQSVKEGLRSFRITNQQMEADRLKYSPYAYRPEIITNHSRFQRFPWTYADCCQCEDRSHRIGQKTSVTCYYFLGRQTIDEQVYNIIQTKKNITNAVTGATDEIEENVVDMVARIFNSNEIYSE